MASDLYNASVEEQFAALQEVTRLTGALHEAQKLQLQLWPMLVFQDAIRSEFSWDNDKKTVDFKITLPEGSKRAKGARLAKTRVGILNGWIQRLLGGEWIAVVSYNGATLRGQRQINGSGEPAREERTRSADRKSARVKAH